MRMDNLAQYTLEGDIYLKEGYILDMATGKPVDGRKPEEVVRQEYEKILHEDYNYNYNQMDIEVFIQRGSRKKPKHDKDRADIVLYKSSKKEHRDQNRDILGIVETKRPHREQGIRQLMSYMSASSCSWGVWTNGNEIEYLFKDHETGKIKRNFIFQIPARGQSFEDIGRISKKDLKPAKNLKIIFKRILNVLYANTNISRREKLGSEMIRLLFCKIWDEKYNISDPPKFKIGFKEKPQEVKNKIEDLFNVVKSELVEDGVFDLNEKIMLDAKSLAYIIGELEQFSLIKTDKDTIGDAFEVFAESKFVGEKGEFFTPREVVRMCVRMIDPKPQEKIFDPACGSGGFLIYALEHIWNKMKEDPKYKGSPKFQLEKMRIAERCFFGIDKEIDLVKIAKAYMAIVGDGRGNIVQENTLHNLNDYNDRSKLLFTKNGKSPRKFDIILTNPPFGRKIKVIDSDILETFELGHKWARNGENWRKTNTVKKTEPQILFIERCLDFLKDGGRMAIVLPEGIFGNPTDGWVREYIKERAEILAIVDCPPETFLPHTHTKTSVLFLRKWDKRRTANYPIFCGIVSKCGHDARGKEIRKPDGSLDEEFSNVANIYLTNQSRIIEKWDRLGFTLFEGKLENGILIPRYYNPETKQMLKDMDASLKYEMKSIKQLIDGKLITIRGAGSTVRPTEYGTGNIPFIRTSDICNWEISHDAKHRVAEEFYTIFSEKQDIQANDIILVKDGTFLIGNTALVTQYDTKILLQSHFLIIRSLDQIKMNPYLLLYLLNCDIVKKQMNEKIFVQATLSTIGNRLTEIILPIPKQKEAKEKVITSMKKVFLRAKLREEINQSLNLASIAQD